MAETAIPDSMRTEPQPGESGQNGVVATSSKSLAGASLLKRSFAELFGSFVIVLVGLGVYLWAVVQAGDRLPVSLAFGFTVLAVVVLFGSVSGGYFNPATTLAGAIAGRISWLTAAIYAIMQVIGALFAGLVLFVVVSAVPLLAGQVGQAFTQLGNGFDDRSPLRLPMLSAGLIELIAAAILAAVVLAAFRPGAERSGLSRIGGAVAVGLTYAGLFSLLAPLTNSGFNPGRSMAVLPWADPVLWGQVWLFWVAPLAGAALAGLIYRGFVAPEGDVAALAAAPRAAGEADSAPLTIAEHESAEEAAQGAPVPAGKHASADPGFALADDPAEGTVDPETKDFFDKK